MVRCMDGRPPWEWKGSCKWSRKYLQYRGDNISFFFFYSSISLWSQPQTLLTNGKLLRVVGTVTNWPKHQIKECSFSLNSKWLLTYRNAVLVLPELPVCLSLLVFIFRSLKFACFFSEMSHRHTQTYMQLIKRFCHTGVGQTKQVFKPDLLYGYSSNLLLSLVFLRCLLRSW